MRSYARITTNVLGRNGCNDRSCPLVEVGGQSSKNPPTSRSRSIFSVGVGRTSDLFTREQKEYYSKYANFPALFCNYRGKSVPSDQDHKIGEFLRSILYVEQGYYRLITPFNTHLVLNTHLVTKIHISNFAMLNPNKN